MKENYNDQQRVWKWRSRHWNGSSKASGIFHFMIDETVKDKAVAESGFTKEFVEEHGEYSSLSSVLLGTSAPFDSYYYAEDPQAQDFQDSA